MIRLNKTEIQLRRLTATFTIDADDANKWQYPLNRNSGLHIHCEINIVVTIRERNLKNGRIARDIWSTAIAGTVAAPLMIVIILLAAEKSVMGEFTPWTITVVLVRIAITATVRTFHSELGQIQPQMM